MICKRSVIDAFAAFARIYVVKTTISWDTSSSKQYFVIYGPGREFYAYKPSKTCWIIMLSGEKLREVFGVGVAYSSCEVEMTWRDRMRIRMSF